MDITALAKSIFEFADNEGFNCLMILFDMMKRYAIKTSEYPDSNLALFGEIESTALYLIKVAEDNKLNMNDTLNSTTNLGQTLFHNAALYSELLASYLLKRNVVITTVDQLFQIPSFRVS